MAAPLFIIHGANDPRVPLGEAEQLAAALRDRAAPNRYSLSSGQHKRYPAGGRIGKTVWRLMGGELGILAADWMVRRRVWGAAAAGMPD
jgi:acetyl esterase/lipase